MKISGEASVVCRFGIKTSEKENVLHAKEVVEMNLAVGVVDDIGGKIL